MKVEMKIIKTVSGNDISKVKNCELQLKNPAGKWYSETVKEQVADNLIEAFGLKIGGQDGESIPWKWNTGNKINGKKYQDVIYS